MRDRLRGIVACLLVLGAAPGARAACGDRPRDAGDLAAARAVAAGRCDCDAATSHAPYVQCVARVASEAVAAGDLRRECRVNLVRCGARSSCGRRGAVPCCRTNAEGIRRCSIRQAAACTPPPGGTACLGDGPSCCDGCGPGRCEGPSTTTTTLPAGPCTGDLDCDDGNPCSQDRCIGGACEHECQCVGPAGRFTCCPGPAAECDPPGPVWFYTCGDPVCGGHRDLGIRPCAADETAGASCAPAGETCDPGSFCNERLLCATSDPTHGGLCPISRRRHKEDIRYLGAGEVRRLHDELMKFPLATYRYKDAASRTHLGFVIEDVEPSLSVDPGRDTVDLYAYTTMAVAALQAQARRIEALERELQELRSALGKRARQDRSTRPARAPGS